ncbi:5-methyltetrahydropteroyltriglutamate--homocysteine S-methyltransferase [Sulfurospirillum sp. T05]|uniref:5-methyltetrahydropteroyltriglutamate--homocysteine methyltransferase n=1 Tax=Sulfurospirillum tamanense TaxID=2813362 RepID=A0ABS2WRJ5_9BACT|nr:5-methyltetrahydropteroyltriglutamate--homocysteine S-methyltransferase [Sulfurospirillum tamanensis]MBN2964291.1 5-methyltetrahydropteroyltriglutamate--homocysteine S-methyltransferase [Sulfurospirillum tamanensis]
MPKNTIIGFPRIGEKRELKHALEAYWSGQTAFATVQQTALTLKRRHWGYQQQAGIALISCNDFSLYDTMLDTAVMLGAIPLRFADISDSTVQYFTMARGDEKRVAMEMTKWFNTNYHYIVPELSAQTRFKLNATKVLSELEEARAFGIIPKVNLIGPLTFLSLAKATDNSDVFAHLDRVVELYEQLLTQLAQHAPALYVQFDEPILSLGTDPLTQARLGGVYKTLSCASPALKLIVTTYFDHAKESVVSLAKSGVWGIGLDFVHGKENLDALGELGDLHLIAGVVDGRNVWKNDIRTTLELLERIASQVPKERICISTSCSLLHVPYTLAHESKLDKTLSTWLSFALEKLEEVTLLSQCFHGAPLSPAKTQALEANRAAAASRKTSDKIHNKQVQTRLQTTTKWKRDLPYTKRIVVQKAALNYPDLATTTIGSFPQTPALRHVRREYKNGTISSAVYETHIKAYIDECLAFQESIDLDVLVHGEPERNDMVEYFGEQLEGFAFTQNGWVQSYGSRCVKPPLLYGDISRPSPMTVAWITYAQSKTQKIVKGMLTGPVTILNWSFVRNDKPKKEIAQQIALAICDEINDLQEAGIGIVQVDEAAFKEGYPLRQEKHAQYEEWALESFRLSTSSAHPRTQIHTHMCYSEFRDIIHTIKAMDADVISIETARSGNKLLQIFKEIGYEQEIGPGIYDIHSPRVPSVEEMVTQIHALLEVFPKEQLWINPDCGLKTRKWEEVKPSLANMVTAVNAVRG